MLAAARTAESGRPGRAASSMAASTSAVSRTRSTGSAGGGPVRPRSPDAFRRTPKRIRRASRCSAGRAHPYPPPKSLTIRRRQAAFAGLSQDPRADRTADALLTIERRGGNEGKRSATLFARSRAFRPARIYEWLPRLRPLGSIDAPPGSRAGVARARASCLSEPTSREAVARCRALHRPRRRGRRAAMSIRRDGRPPVPTP
jgi:hypothetical protein